jgi:ethanolamine ammonia-lyase large subunit
MKDLSRKRFIRQTGLFGASLIFLPGFDLFRLPLLSEFTESIHIEEPMNGEDVFAYIRRLRGNMDQSLYRQIIGAANEFKEGDLTIGVAAESQESRLNARALLSQTKIMDLFEQPLFRDEQYDLINATTAMSFEVGKMRMIDLKTFVLNESEEKIKLIMPSLSSDVIACLVKLMSNEELIVVGQKVFNPLPGSKIGSKGYLSARIQPNSPTDDIEDIVWQVFDGWSYGVGDLVLGTNPVSSEAESVARIEAALYEIIQTFGLEKTIPNSVLSHIDIQAKVEEMQAGSTGIWFQSLAGTVEANKTFDLTIEKMFQHAAKRKGQYGLYAETGQGADFTNGHGEGFDMVVHEARKYGFLRALKQKMSENRKPEDLPWVFVNDVAGFIGPEVFKSKEQLVRCCLEDTVMGKLHGLTIGLDICSTLHMDVTLDDLNWCIDQVMPANPAYLMALPTKNDPMLGYLTTAFSDHVRIREKFGYKVNDAMWKFFQDIEIIDYQGKPTTHFGDPVWVYYQYCKAKLDIRSQKEIFEEGQQCIQRIRKRGVFISEGYGKNYWDLPSELKLEVHDLYEDAKISIWSQMTPAFVASIPGVIPIITCSKDRKDYVYHPETGEKISVESIGILENQSQKWQNEVPDVQIIISDGLNARSLMDEVHLSPYLHGLVNELRAKNYRVSPENIVITNGRVRAGYACGEILFGKLPASATKKGIIHIIGERPGSVHHNFSAYLTAASANTWKKTGKVDHNISRVVSGISDTSLVPELAVQETVNIFDRLFNES